MKLKITHKLIGLFSIIGLTPFLLISAYAFFNSKAAMQKNAIDKLSSIQENRKEAISLYMGTVQNQVSIWGQNTMIIQAMRSFASTFEDFKDDAFTDFSKEKEIIVSSLATRYHSQESMTIDAPKSAKSLWWPKEWYVQYLQYLYISNNPFPIETKSEMVTAQNDDSLYASAHEQYHPILRSLSKKFEYYDIFLVEAKNARIVYSVAKELDFGTSLLTGPWADTHIADLFKQTLFEAKPGATFFSDFKAYPPSYNRFTSFVASPVYYGEVVVGALIFQLPVDRINRIMTNDYHWENVGLGKSGECVLVGPDFKFRSNSRHLIETPGLLENQLLGMGVPEQTIALSLKMKSAVGILPYSNPQVDAALKGNSGVELTTDFRGRTVLAGYSPLNAIGTQWAILTTIDETEAFDSFFKLKRAMIYLGIAGIILVLGFGLYCARSISRPLNKVIDVLSASSAQITTSVAQQESVIQQQASSVQETNNTMEELGSSSKLTAAQAESAAAGAQQVLELSETGRLKMDDMVLGMGTLKHKVDDIAKQILHLSEQTGKIGDITSLVSDFANETKMLAMNAAVEAVRAGEHGKGFSVLSVEIRKLADESKRSAERISSLVSEIQKVTNATVMATEEGTKNVEQGAQLARTTSETFHNVSSAIGEAAQNTGQISLNAQQQAIAVKQVIEAITTLNQNTKETTSGVVQVKAGVLTLNQAATTLKEMV